MQTELCITGCEGRFCADISQPARKSCCLCSFCLDVGPAAPRLPTAALLLLGRSVSATLRFLCFTGSVWHTPMGIAGTAADLAGLMEALRVATLCSWHLLCASVLAGSEKTLLPAAMLLLPSSVGAPCRKTQDQISAVLRP